MRAIVCAVSLVFPLVVPAFSSAQTGPLPPQEPAALINANVVNVRDGTILPKATIVIRDGKIASVGPGAAPAGVKVIDVRGKFVIPGLIDAHTHIANFRAARTALESGVTTVRSAGVAHYVDVGMRELVKKGALAGPDILAAGYHVRPQLAEEAFLSDPVLSPFMNGRVTTTDAIRQVVKANLSHGVDWIKTTSTERAGLPETDPRRQLYTDAEVKVMVEGTQIGAILGAGDLKVNSFHHQAIDRLGRGLRDVAWAPDGVIEAVEGEDDGGFVVGVQWHPEDLVDYDPAARSLFSALISAARR